MEWIFFSFFLALYALFVILPYWTLKKAGWSGWWCLAFTTGLIGVIVLWYFAFARWPNEPGQKETPAGAA